MAHTLSNPAEQAELEDIPWDGLDEPDYYASPGHIRAVAHLYGIKTAPLGTARVLELGCGGGRNLYAFALAHPQAHVVGVDLWPDVLAQGQKNAATMGLQNLHLLPLLYSDIRQDFGLFDYIIVRDEYIWAPDAMRKEILRICAENLAPDGVAYVGVHTYPGWRAGDILRDAIQLHGHTAVSLEELRASAGAMLGMMADGMAAQAADGNEIRKAARRLLQHPEYYINSNFLERSSTAPYFLDLLGEAGNAGLMYAGDARPDTELGAGYGHHVHFQQSLLSLGQEWPVKQQYLDFAVNRQFRRSLFVSQQNDSNLSQSMQRDRLKQLHFACALRRKLSFTLPSELQTQFISPSHQVHGFQDELVIAVCDILGRAWPHTLDFDDLLAATTVHVMPGADAPERTEALLCALETLMRSGQLHYHLEPGPYNAHQGESVQLLRFLENAADEDWAGGAVHFNLWNDAQRVQLESSPATMKMVFHSIGQGDHNYLKSNPELIGFIENLRWYGLLCGSDQAWIKLYACVLALPGIEQGQDQEEQEKQSRNRKLHLLPSYIVHHRSASKAAGGKPAPAAGAKKAPVVAQMRELFDLRLQKKYEKLEPLLDAFIKQHPDHEYGWYILALARRDQGRIAESLDAFLQALARRVDDMELYNGVVHTVPEVKGALLITRVMGLALWINPRNPGVYINLGNAYRENENKPKALQCYLQALEIDAGHLPAEKNLGVLYGESGDLKNAIAVLKKCIEKQPDDFAVHSNYLYTLSMYDQVSAEQLHQAHLFYGKQVARAAKKSGLALVHKNEKKHDRTLRLGFVSGDLRNHAVARFIEPIWRHLDKDAFRIHVYSTHGVEDVSTTVLKALAEQWTLVRDMSDAELAKKIQEDQIDVLFDLSGHTGYNRLPMFGLKPAPVQISWIGYPGTTGLAAMDYYLVNKFIAPEGMTEIENQFTEKLLRLPATGSFESPTQALKVNALPALGKGYVTFGSFNRINKVNPEMFRVWADIMCQVPNSRFMMGHIESDSFKPLRDIFASYGIAEDRILFRPRTTVEKYMALHHDVDLLLDTFPYNGGTTTYYGLWMGVPTLTLAGCAIPSRTGVAILGPLGLDEFIAHSTEDYVAKAVALANDLPYLSKIRQSARSLFSEGSVMSSEAVTRSLEQAIRRVWQNWCDGKPPRSISFD